MRRIVRIISFILAAVLMSVSVMGIDIISERNVFNAKVEDRETLDVDAITLTTTFYSGWIPVDYVEYWYGTIMAYYTISPSSYTVGGTCANGHHHSHVTTTYALSPGNGYTTSKDGVYTVRTYIGSTINFYYTFTCSGSAG